MINSPLITHPDPRFKRLYFRGVHRGSKEMDIVLGHFAEALLLQLTTEPLATYERLLEEDDTTLWDWLTEKAAVPSEYRELIEMIRHSQLSAAGKR